MTVEENKKLIEKYPFLAPKEYDWDYYDKTGEDRYIIPAILFQRIMIMNLHG